MIEVGRLCVKIAGRDAGKKCVVVDVLGKNIVLIDGQTRRRKCNVTHLEPLRDVLKIKKGAPHAEIVVVFKKLGLEVKETKAKKAAARPRHLRKTKKTSSVVAEKPAKEKKTKQKTLS
ncbi:50S ribosomal protein L14e [Candidatus Woesearchaeota archaeon]|nr:50S ribosomal protein L14e [Candidatus Woesearchaeota archaeon]